jgi:zinc protease
MNTPQEGLPFYTVSGRAREVAHLFVRGLPVDHWTRLRERLDDTRAEEMPELQYEYIESDKMQIVLVGDPKIIRDQVSSLGLGDLRELTLGAP